MKIDNNVAVQQPADRTLNARTNNGNTNNSYNNFAETQNDTQSKRLTPSSQNTNEPSMDFDKTQETPLQCNQKPNNNGNRVNSKNIDSTAVLETVGNVEVIITHSPDSSNQATALHGKCLSSGCKESVSGKSSQQRRDKDLIDRENEPFLMQSSCKCLSGSLKKIDRLQTAQLSDDTNETKVWI